MDGLKWQSLPPLFAPVQFRLFLQQIGDGLLLVAKLGDRAVQLALSEFIVFDSLDDAPSLAIALVSGKLLIRPASTP